MTGLGYGEGHLWVHAEMGLEKGPELICYKSVLDSCSSSGNWQAVVAWQLDPKDMVDPLLARLSTDSDARILYRVRIGVSRTGSPASLTNHDALVIPRPPVLV